MELEEEIKMLKTNKTITINGSSEIEGKQAAYMSATLSTDSTSASSVVKNITNQELYKANSAAVRKDMDDFSAEVYKVEDEFNKVEVQA